MQLTAARLVIWILDSEMMSGDTILITTTLIQQSRTILDITLNLHNEIHVKMQWNKWYSKYIQINLVRKYDAEEWAAVIKQILLIP